MAFRAFALCLSLCILPGHTVSFGQGTFHLSFEEFPLLAVPPYATKLFELEQTPFVGDSSTWSSVAAYDGTKYLDAAGVILIGAPNQQPIASFSMRVYVSQASSLFPPTFSVDARAWSGVHLSSDHFGSWQTIDGTLPEAVPYLHISSLYYFDYEFPSPLRFALDSIDLVTIPEPSILAICALTSGLLFLIFKSATPHTKALHGTEPDLHLPYMIKSADNCEWGLAPWT